MPTEGPIQIDFVWWSDSRQNQTVRLEWSVTLDDPSTWTGPWTFSMALTRNSEERIMEYACHEGNRAMANTLSGARAEERASQEKGK